VVMTGRGRHLGTEVAWQLRCRPDGAFLEDIRGEHLSFSWGHPGGAASCWEARAHTHPHASPGALDLDGAPVATLQQPGPVGQRCCAAAGQTGRRPSTGAGCALPRMYPRLQAAAPCAPTRRVEAPLAWLLRGRGSGHWCPALLVSAVAPCCGPQLIVTALQMNRAATRIAGSAPSERACGEAGGGLGSREEPGA
jgi:hypothetical protein